MIYLCYLYFLRILDLRQVGGFLPVLRFPPPIKLTAMIGPGSLRPDSRSPRVVSPRFSNHKLINKAVYLVNYNRIQL